jgi:hypothetical protein
MHEENSAFIKQLLDQIDVYWWKKKWNCKNYILCMHYEIVYGCVACKFPLLKLPTGNQSELTPLTDKRVWWS